MTPSRTMAILLGCALLGAAARALPGPVDAGVAHEIRDGPGVFATSVGDLRGVLIPLAGCPSPIGLARIPGYRSGLDYGAVQWSRGAADTLFWLGSRRLTAGWARVATTAAQGLFVAGRAVGLPSPVPPFAVVAFVPSGCRPNLSDLDRLVRVTAAGSRLP